MPGELAQHRDERSPAHGLLPGSQEFADKSTWPCSGFAATSGSSGPTTVSSGC
ncbi:MAG: hypothetical protein ACLGI3_02880 [Actinomycetes bacterium]